MLWNAADQQQPANLNAEDYGWNIMDGVPHPVTGPSRPAAPAELMKVVASTCSTDTSCNHKNCSCKSDNYSCTTFSMRQASNACNNEHTVKLSEGQDTGDGHE